MPAYLLENLVMENAPVCGWLKMGVPIGEISMISRGKIPKVGAPERDQNFQRNDKAWIQLGLGIPGDTVASLNNAAHPVNQWWPLASRRGQLTCITWVPKRDPNDQWPSFTGMIDHPVSHGIPIFGECQICLDMSVALCSSEKWPCACSCNRDVVPPCHLWWSGPSPFFQVIPSFSRGYNL